MTPKLELAKQRDFGELISDTFVFVKENFKPLVKAFFTFSGLFLIGGITTTIMHYMHTANLVKGFDVPYDRGDYQPFSALDVLGWEYALAMIFMLLNYTMIIVTTVCYITLYKEKNKVAPNNAELWGYIKHFYPRVLLSSIPIILLLIVGFIFCVIPFFYLYPIMALIYPIMIIENTSFGYAFNRSFSMIKDNWWVTFGAFFVMGIIISFASGVVNLPATILNVGTSLLSPTSGKGISITGGVLAGVLGNISMIFQMLSGITVALSYYSLNEHHEGTGLLSRINQLGNNQPGDASQPAEEY
jgi:hypothetical protein